MNIELKASLQNHIQKWLDKNAVRLGENEGIWQDDSCYNRNAALMANACEIVVDAMRLQSELGERFN